MKIHHLISDAWSCSKIGTSLIEYIDSKINNIDFEENVKPSYIEYINSENEYKICAICCSVKFQFVSSSKYILAAVI